MAKQNEEIRDWQVVPDDSGLELNKAAVNKMSDEEKAEYEARKEAMDKVHLEDEMRRGRVDRLGRKTALAEKQEKAVAKQEAKTEKEQAKDEQS